MKAWITKYALTSGIEEREVMMEYDDGMISVVNKGGYSEFYHGEGREWHRTKEDAVKSTEEARQKKIKNLEKQILKLKSLKFE